MGDVKNLEPHGIIGFDGSVIKGLKAHPDGEHIVYPVGNKVCIQNWFTKQMTFLSGHSNSISTIAVSPKGTYIGSGQINHIGFKAPTNIWHFAKKMLLGSHELHKVRVEALAFTTDERYMISLGGRDDGSVVLWDCEQNAANGTAQAVRLTTGDALTVCALSVRGTSFVTGGDGNLRVWNIHPVTTTLDVKDVSMGKLRRRVRCIAVSADDKYGIAGTSTGDMIKFSINYPEDKHANLDEIYPGLIACVAKCGKRPAGKRPEVQLYSQGVEAVLIMKDHCLIVGSGDGTVDILDEINWTGPMPKGKIVDPSLPLYKSLKSCKLDGAITSLELLESPKLQNNRRLLLVGTRTSEIYAVNVNTFNVTLVVTCHRCAINDIAFPPGFSGVFATAGAGSVRVWCLDSCQELLRIEVPNFTCSSVLFAADGKSIVSAWNDGNIRAFTPLTGRLMYCIYNTHNKGTSAIGMTRDGRTLVSGGCEGQVRVWDILPNKQSLKKVLKEHKSPVSAIQVHPNDTEAVSAGTDGSCIIWDLVSLSRRQVMYANTLFMCVCFEPRGCQLLTSGTDRRVAYWETGSGNLARELEASKSGAVNGLHVSSNGELFVTGANDQIVKLWKYQEGVYTHIGLGHAGAVTTCKFADDMRHVVSACAAGTLIVWRVPEIYIPKAGSKPPSLKEELRLPLASPPRAAAPAARAAPAAAPAPGSGDRRLPAAPSKEEKIGAMDTTRSSVHTVCCPCPPGGSGGSGRAGGASGGSQGDKAKPSPKMHSVTNTKSCCQRKNSTDNLPTRTTSKEYVNSGGGDRK